MATKLEIIITYDQDSKKCAIEWTTAESQDVTTKEKNMLSKMKTAILLQLDGLSTPSNVH